MLRKCPKCKCLDVRRSSFGRDDVSSWWRSRSPYRCNRCGERFWVVSRRFYRVTGVAAAVIAAFAVEYGVTSLLFGHDSGNIHHGAVATPLQTPIVGASEATVVARAFDLGRNSITR